MIGPAASVRPAEIIDVVLRDGITIRALDWGGTGPPVVFLHPNGFCGGLYEPIARTIGDDARRIAIDLRGHGGSSTPTEASAYRFETLALDVVEALDQLDLSEVAGVGGSLGGAIAILVHRLDPRRWTKLLLAEPVAFPTDAVSHGTENPMAAAARRRRSTFASRADMIDSYRSRAPMSGLALEALEAYVRWGTIVDTRGVHLACPPEVEATIFEVSASAWGAADAWGHLPALSCPTTIVAGESTFLPDVFAAQAERGHAELVVVEGGHFVLHESTIRGADLIVRHALS